MRKGTDKVDDPSSGSRCHRKPGASSQRYILCLTRWYIELPATVTKPLIVELPVTGVCRFKSFPEQLSGFHIFQGKG